MVNTILNAIESLHLKSSFDELKVLQQNFSQIETERMNTRIRQTVHTSDVRIDAENSLKI